MNLLTKPDIGKALTAALSQAISVKIASAFFSPGTEMLKLLNTVQDVELVISEEFTVNDPKKIEALQSAVVKSIPTDSDQGKLHAKVLIIALSDGSDWVSLGSANFTDQGLFFNQEVCVTLSSEEESDRSTIVDIKNWFKAVWRCSRPVDLEQAKKIWEMYGAARKVPKLNLPTAAPAYYAIKTTSGGADKKEHWGRFEAESVIAIGWEDIAGDPSLMSEGKLRSAIREAYPTYSKDSENFAFNTIRKFIEMPEQSIVMVCRGLTPNQDTLPVRIYAFVRLIGPFHADKSVPPEWRFKRSVVMQRVEKRLEPQVFSALIGMRSLMKTLHELDQASVEAIAAELGIQLGI